MRLLTVEVKVETVAGIRMAKWTGAFDERMQVVVPDSMPAEAFHPGSNVNYYNTYGNGGAYINAAGGNALVAPVYLPDGATVTRLTVYFNDSSSGNLTVNFNKLSFTGGYTVLAQVVSSGASGYQSGSDTTISGSTINNTDGGYLIYAYSTAWDSNLKLMGVLITYTISEAP